MHFSKGILKNQLFLLCVFAVLVIIICIVYSRYSLPVPTLNSYSTRAAQPSITTAPTNTLQVSEQTSLSPSDAAVRTSLLMKTLHAKNQSGVVYKSPIVQIEYVATDEMFQSEILTTQIEAAKHETEMWFRLQGLSQKGICNLPLIFYLSGTVKENLSITDSHVTLLPDGC